MSVVLYHAASAGHIEQLLAALPAFVGVSLLHGSLGVAVFFVLSGFVIPHSLFEKRMTAAEFGRFTLKRSLRLDPPYWVSIVAVILFAALSAQVVAGKEAPSYTAPQILAHAVYLQDILGYMAINPVYWTLCLEFQFYLLYAAILMLAKDRAHAWLLGAAAISLPWAMGIVPQLPGLFPTLWYAFLAGTLAYWAWRQPRSTVIPFWAFLGVLFIAGTIRGDGFTLVAAFTAMLLYLSAHTGWIHSGLNWRSLQFLGLVSYSLYLTHNIATGVTFRIGSMLMERTVATEFLWWIASIVGCVVLAGAFWWMFERPSLAWARRIGKRVRPLSAPLPIHGTPHST